VTPLKVSSIKLNNHEIIKQNSDNGGAASVWNGRKIYKGEEHCNYFGRRMDTLKRARTNFRISYTNVTSELLNRS
jgi:hypothetical protein